jgi:hypothetical protein
VGVLDVDAAELLRLTLCDGVDPALLAPPTGTTASTSTDRPPTTPRASRAPSSSVRTTTSAVGAGDLSSEFVRRRAPVVRPTENS